MIKKFAKLLSAISRLINRIFVIIWNFLRLWARGHECSRWIFTVCFEIVSEEPTYWPSWLGRLKSTGNECTDIFEWKTRPVTKDLCGVIPLWWAGAGMLTVDPEILKILHNECVHRCVNLASWLQFVILPSNIQTDSPEWNLSLIHESRNRENSKGWEYWCQTLNIAHPCWSRCLDCICCPSFNNVTRLKAALSIWLNSHGRLPTINFYNVIPAPSHGAQLWQYQLTYTQSQQFDVLIKWLLLRRMRTWP